jgi:hypothetical protein
MMSASIRFSIRVDEPASQVMAALTSTRLNLLVSWFHEIAALARPGIFPALPC